MKSSPDLVALLLLTVIGVCGGLAAADLLHLISLPDLSALPLGVGAFLLFVWWVWWDVEIKGRN